MKLAAETWHGDWWKYGGGGTVWTAMTYDEEFHQIISGTGNGSPWNQKIRGKGKGDNIFLCSIGDTSRATVQPPFQVVVLLTCADQAFLLTWRHSSTS